VPKEGHLVTGKAARTHWLEAARHPGNPGLARAPPPPPVPEGGAARALQPGWASSFNNSARGCTQCAVPRGQEVRRRRRRRHPPWGRLPPGTLGDRCVRGARARGRGRGLPPPHTRARLEQRVGAARAGKQNNHLQATAHGVQFARSPARSSGIRDRDIIQKPDTRHRTPKQRRLVASG
jgi:hypothetical protein